MFEQGNKYEFKKGVSGNPNGRPKDVSDLAKMCRGHTEICLKVLLDILTNGAAHKDKLRAIEILLARGYGQPIQGVIVSGSLDHNIRPVIHVTIGDTTTTIESPPTRQTRALPDVDS
jgi:hypothetical protein